MRNIYTHTFLLCVDSRISWLWLALAGPGRLVFYRFVRKEPEFSELNATVVISLAKEREKGDLPRCWCQNVERFIVCKRSTARGQPNGRRSWRTPQFRPMGGPRRIQPNTTHSYYIAQNLYIYFQKNRQWTPANCSRRNRDTGDFANAPCTVITTPLNRNMIIEV